MRTLLILCLAFVSAQIYSAAGPNPVFEKKGLIFKDVKEGEILQFEYTFTNKGDADFKIDHVHPTCGCTTPEWPRQAIKPGETGKIKVKFDSKGRVGYNAKGINITSNAGEINLVFEVYVIE